MTRTPAKQIGGKWADNAFPTEATKNFDEFEPETVRELKATVEQEAEGETWEVVDGLKFPYELFA